VHTSGLDADRLPFPVENALYRIVQEALTNIAKHAAANVVSIALECQPSRIQVIVTDDGCGLDTEMTLRTTTISNRLGLYGMYERATLLGGSISVGSKPGKGPPSPCKSQLKAGNHAPEMDHNVRVPVSKSPDPGSQAQLSQHGGWLGHQFCPPIREKREAGISLKWRRVHSSPAGGDYHAKDTDPHRR
jgi:Histidine kinase-, DNA gyrase B-, and HSP90-like ATPase